MVLALQCGGLRGAKLEGMCLPHSRCVIIITYLLWMTSHHEVMSSGVTKNVHISKLQF